VESEKDLADFADFSKFAGTADDTEPADYSKWRFALLAWRSSARDGGPGGPVTMPERQVSSITGWTWGVTLHGQTRPTEDNLY